MKRGEIATVAQMHRFLSEREGALRSQDERRGLLSRRQAKPKTGRPRHEKTDAEEQEDFEKSLPRR